MFRKKFIRQENMNDCGVACLLMIMRYYGGNYPIEQLRDIVKIDKNGTTALNLINAAVKVGFDARGYRCDNYQDLKCPSIAHVIINKTYHHFVVINKIDINKKIITISDPASGPKKYTFDEFNQIWTHVVINLYPIRKIDNINIIKNVRKTIYQIIKPYQRLFIFIFILSIVYTIFNIINTFYFKIIIDNNSLSFVTCLYLFIFFLLITIIKIVVDFMRNRLLIYVDQKIDKSLMGDTFKHLLSLPWHYYSSRTTGDIISRLNDLSYVRELISKSSVIILVDLVLIIGSSIVMCLINISLFLITIIILFIYFIIVYLFNRSIKYFIMTNQEAGAVVSSSLVESIKGINTIKNLNLENETYHKVMTKYNALVNNNYHFQLKYNFIKVFKDFIINGGLLTITFWGSILISKGTLSISDFIIFNFFINFFLDPMRNIFEVEPLLRASSSALVRTSEFYNIEKEAEGKEETFLKGDILLNNVTYAYNGRDKVVTGLEFKINDGEKVMICGPSGSGKSTVAKMIMRYLETDPNKIIINNKDILDYSLSAIRHNICYISQDELLFTDSLYNNITLNREVKDNDIKKVLDMTCINEIMNNHNLDYYMLLEENGSNLSGGEKQRIIIARALLKQSQIFIFDESMSEMNVSLERKILQNIFTNYSDKTMIVISHRLDNSDLYDKIINLDNANKRIKEGVGM